MLYVPIGLRRMIEALALSFPLAALEVIVIKRAPWWRLPYHQMGVALAVTAVIYLFLSFIISTGKKTSWYVVGSAMLVWIISSGWTSLRLHNTNLSMFTLVLAACASGFMALLNVELSRSYLDPDMAWFEGLPKPIPGVACDVVVDAQKTPFRVARLDREGVFVFREKKDSVSSSLKKGLRHDLVLSFRDREVRCAGFPVRYFDRRGNQNGIGFQFKQLSPDVRKNLGDFIESLHGEGYVS